MRGNQPMTAPMFQVPAGQYTIEQVSVLTGLPMPTVRRMAGRNGFPPFNVVGIAPVFDAAAVDAWRKARAVEVANWPSRYEVGPYPSAERSEAAARRMNRYGVGAVSVVSVATGEHWVFVPVPEGIAPDKIGRELVELFPTAVFRLYDFGYCDDIQPAIG